MLMNILQLHICYICFLIKPNTLKACLTWVFFRHALDDFHPIDIRSILPASFDNSKESIIWASIDTLFEHDLIRGKRIKKV